jgi:hypothetical protein
MLTLGFLETAKVIGESLQLEEYCGAIDSEYTAAKSVRDPLLLLWLGFGAITRSRFGAAAESCQGLQHMLSVSNTDRMQNANPESTKYTAHRRQVQHPEIKRAQKGPNAVFLACDAQQLVAH